LMVCLGIIGILMIIGSFSILNFNKSNRLRTEAYSLVCNLQRAKIEAVKENSDVVIQMFATGYQVFIDDGKGGGLAGDWIRQPQEKMLFSCVLTDGLVLSNNFSSSRTRFTGRVGTKAGSITMTNSYGHQKKIIINTVGRIRVED
jgi:Tfp pilus assembly protein FimT